MQFSTLTKLLKIFQDMYTIHKLYSIYQNMMEFKICTIYAIKYQFYLYDRVHTTLVKNLSTSWMYLQICGSYLDNKYVQYTNCLNSHQDKRITNTHEITPYYEMKIPYFSSDKLYFIIHRSIILTMYIKLLAYLYYSNKLFIK